MEEGRGEAELMGISQYVGTWRRSGLCLQVQWRTGVRNRAEKKVT